ncbi:unnamed protein product [Periconia digitata]|uniref:UBC core domain-containing protein n=1 Tax=Periconia digitata TaxID=1303443 RepID=A0A9W4U6D3_9PLEO|nr:unnamed protein product [Periconia digitata]
MPRRQFKEDLKQAINGVSTTGISNVHEGEDDGVFSFNCTSTDGQVELTVRIPEVYDYPTSHDCMIFAADDAPSNIAASMAAISVGASRKTVLQILEHVSQCLQSRDKDDNIDMVDSQDYDGLQEDSDEEADDFFPDEDHMSQHLESHMSYAPGSSSAKPNEAFINRVRADLWAAKSAGFKVGGLGGLMDGRACYVSLSIRVSKLGISTEAMEAWQLGRNEYLVLIISYPNGYKPAESILNYDTSNAINNFAMRIGVSTTYKPTLQEAIRAFTDLNKGREDRRDEETSGESQSSTEASPRGFRDAFISKSLNGLFADRFAQLLKYRYNGMSWYGAETFYHESLEKTSHSELGLEDRFLNPDDANSAWPSVVMADHIRDCPMTQPQSLPLIGMQFALRHFVRCTEFCLVCFSKLSNDLQAIKPYVCDNKFCLWQYMSLGFGPSIEHEILSQPKVVDLLISFCYHSARMGKLADFPNGLSLMVPSSTAYGTPYNSMGMTANNTIGWRTQPQTTPQEPAPTTASEVAIKMGYNEVTKEIMFADRNVPCPLHTGQWLVIRTDHNPEPPLHCRVTDTSFYPTVSVSEPVQPAIVVDQPPQGVSSYFAQPQLTPNVQNRTPAITSTQPRNNIFQRASFYIYKHNFDELTDSEKRVAIIALLDLLPSVADMKRYLQRRAQSALSAWVDRLPPAGWGVLRWIIASNRACIMQVAQDEIIGRKSSDRLWGMGGWAQFRFAMGAPDKERRFIDAVRQTTQRLDLKYSTLFAWHGSALQNWHSIIREGLHYKDTINGRAFGHGVYHSLDYNTSLGYCVRGYGKEGSWPKSELQVSQAIALNEIVNSPQEFVSKSPHLVVSQLDWIQTRYLFVQIGNQSASTVNGAGPTETKPYDPIDQDPNYTPNGLGGRLIIPKSAVGGSRFINTKTNTSMYNPIEIDGDDDSVATMAEDRDIFSEESEQQSAIGSVGVISTMLDKGKGAVKTGFFHKLMGKSFSQQAPPLTDYVPGKLDYSTLPMLEMPVWATPAATQRLMRDLKELVKVQAKQPQHQLGWHLDEEKITNMYQWIVELHSFDSSLPLAQDMKRMGHKSIVLELRFGKEYPMCPPFVRVIRPRFLGFTQGGGGHVTLGGAMCMELLTNSGWTSVLSIESILLQVRLEMTSTDPRPARLVSGNQDYGVGEAVEAYIRACNQHGWTIPPGFQELAYGGKPSSVQSQY